MLGDRIKRLRREMRLSQTQLAVKLHVTPGAVSQWETGATRPAFETLDALAEVLGTSMAYLLGSTDDPARATPDDMAADYEAELMREESIWTLAADRRSPDRVVIFRVLKYGSDADARMLRALIEAVRFADPDFFAGK